MLRLTLLFLAVFSQPSTTVPRLIEVSDSRGVASLQALHGALEALNEKSGPCVKGGGAVQACICAHAAELSSVRAHYVAAIKEHPDWTDQQVVYRTTGERGVPVSTTLSIKAYRLQLEQLTCR